MPLETTTWTLKEERRRAPWRGVKGDVLVKRPHLGGAWPFLDDHSLRFLIGGPRFHEARTEFIFHVFHASVTKNFPAAGTPNDLLFSWMDLFSISAFPCLFCEQLITSQLARVEEGNVRRQNSSQLFWPCCQRLWEGVSRSSWSVRGQWIHRFPASGISLAAPHHQHARTACQRTERGIFVNLQAV